MNRLRRLEPGDAPVDEIDEVTLARARRGDRPAQGAVVRCYERRVFALISRIWVGRDKSRVDDLAQETFMKVLRGLPGFQPGGLARLSTWVLTIATRVAIDGLRHERVRTKAGEESGSGTEAIAGAKALGGARDGLAAIEARDGFRQIERAMAGLDADFRAALVLRAFHDLDYAEIAVALGVEEGTVKSRIARARAALRAALGEEGP